MKNWTFYAKSVADAKTKSCPGMRESPPLVGSNLSAVENDPTLQPPRLPNQTSKLKRLQEKEYDKKKKKQPPVNYLFERSLAMAIKSLAYVICIYSFIIGFFFFSITESGVFLYIYRRSHQRRLLSIINTVNDTIR